MIKDLIKSLDLTSLKIIFLSFKKKIIFQVKNWRIFKHFSFKGRNNITDVC